MDRQLSDYLSDQDRSELEHGRSLLRAYLAAQAGLRQLGVLQKRDPIEDVAMWFVRVNLAEEGQKSLGAVQTLLGSYTDARDRLRGLGMLRSERDPQADFAEWLVARMLDLELASSGSQKGYDATDALGNKYQIKARIVASATESTSWDFTKQHDEFDFDFFVGVLLGAALEPLVVIKTSRLLVQEIWNETAASYRVRWNKRVRADDRIERLIGPPGL